MKARKKNSNDEWAEVKYVQLDNSDILYKQEYLEFNTISTEPNTISQIDDEKHWQDVKERAAIAAMQGMLANPELLDESSLDYRIKIEMASVGYANELVERLKKK
jgi:hypothetical protein